MESLPQDYPARDGTSRAVPPPECDSLSVFSRGEAANDTRIAKLARAIEQEIIPRLMLAHRGTPRAMVKPSVGEARISAADVGRFATIVLSRDEAPTLDAILAYRSAGASIESIYLELLAPTARYLGELWSEDLCSFTDVTVGLGRLQRVLRELGPIFGRVCETSSEGRSVLLLPSPGEQHTFGLVMVGEFFRRAGWDVSGGAWTSDADPASLVRAEWFDVVGFSLGAEIHLHQLTGAVRSVRQASCNRDVKVLVGGPLFGEHPEYADKVGADGTTIDGREAPALAERLAGRVATRSAVRRGRPPGDAGG
jgi:methanogenic corrinoid protein MtbC1